MQAQLVSALAHVAQDSVGAGAEHDLVCGVAGDPLSTRIPEGDAPLKVDEVHPVLDLFEDRAVHRLLHSHLLPCSARLGQSH